MSNLSDLLPAGAAAKQLTFTDSGSGIASKAPVVLNSDGTVAQITGSTLTEAVGALSSQIGTLYCAADSTFYDETTDKLVAVNASQSGIEAAYATISGSSTSWVTATNTTAFLTDDRYQTVANITDSNQFVVSFYKNADSYPYVLVATIDTSGGSIVWSTTPVVVNSSNCYYYCSVAYDPTSGNIVCSYNTSTSTSMSSKVGTISGTGASATVSFGSAAVISSTVNLGDHTMCSVGSGKVMLTGYNASTGRGNAYIGTVSGTSVSWGALAETDPNSTIQARHPLCTYIPRLDRVALGYSDVNPGTYHSRVAIGAVSGTSTSWGTNTTIDSTNYTYPTIVIDQPNIGKLVAINVKSNTIYAYTGTINTSTNVYTVDSSAFTIASGYGHSHPGTVLSVCSDNDDQVPVSMRDAGSGASADKMFVKLYTGGGTATNLTATNFVGVADSAISASAAGSVIVQGGTVSGVSSGTGLSLGTAAEVDGAGNSVPQGIVYDSNENKIVVVFQDAGASYSGAAAVGTVSGTSISFGTPVTFDADGIYYAVACFDSSNNKVVIAYADTGNSNYLTAIVGTVSGTSISYGSPVVVESSSGADYKGIAYDANAQKVVIGWRDAGNSNYGSAIVGTVSGTSISFGTKAAFNSAAANVYGVTYDSNAQKVVFSYRDDGTGSGYGRSIVGTVSGTGISFGSATTFDANSYSNNISSGYDSTNNKVIVVFRDQGNSNYGTARVGTVSGTSISFGTAAVFNTEDTQGMSGGCVAEDVNAQKIIIAGDGGTSGGMVVSGTVSGTDITFDTPITTDVGAGENKVIYDSSSNKVVLTYQAESDSYKCVARMTTYGDLPLTVGTKYYVTTSGGFSSSADTPSVNAGLAISTTSLTY